MKSSVRELTPWPKLQEQLPWVLTAARAAITFPSVSSDCLISQKNRAVCALQRKKKNKNPLQKQSTPLPLEVSPWGEEEGTRERERKRMNHMWQMLVTLFNAPLEDIQILQWGEGYNYPSRTEKRSRKKNPFKNKAPKPFASALYNTKKQNRKKNQEKRKQNHSWKINKP